MKTKNIKLFLSIASLSLAMGCTDLNVDIKSQYTTFPNSNEAAEAVAANIYNYYRGALGQDHWMVQTLSSDEAVSVALGSDYYDGGIYMQLDLHSWRPDLGKLSTIWNSAMLGCYLDIQNLTASKLKRQDVFMIPILMQREFF